LRIIETIGERQKYVILSTGLNLTGGIGVKKIGF
jgi:hypothetical protein